MKQLIVTATIYPPNARRLACPVSFVSRPEVRADHSLVFHPHRQPFA